MKIGWRHWNHGGPALLVMPATAAIAKSKRRISDCTPPGVACGLQKVPVENYGALPEFNLAAQSMPRQARTEIQNRALTRWSEWFVQVTTT